METTCFVCQKVFTARRKTRKFCSESCKHSDYLKRNGFKYARGNTVVHDKNTVSDDNMPIEENFLHSPLLQDIDMHECFLRYNDRSNNSADLYWLRIQLKCLLTQLLRLCYALKVEHGTFIELQRAFRLVTVHTNFKYLGNHKIAQYTCRLEREIDRLCFLSSNHGNAKLVIPADQKAVMFAVLANMPSNVPMKPFYELFK